MSCTVAFLKTTGEVVASVYDHPGLVGVHTLREGGVLTAYVSKEAALARLRSNYGGEASRYEIREIAEKPSL